MNLRSTLLPLAACALLAAASCKTNDTPLNVTPTGLLSGYLTTTRTLDIDSPATKYTEQAMAYFTLHPGEALRIPVDSVKVNDFPLALDNATTLYTTGNNVAGQLQTGGNCNWQVWSSGNVSSFSFNNTVPYPVHTYKLPDTISQAGGFNIPLPVSSDSATIAVIGSQSVLKSYNGTSGSFSSTDLSDLSTGSIIVRVTGFKRQTQAFGGKNFRFIKQSVKDTRSWLK